MSSPHREDNRPGTAPRWRKPVLVGLFLALAAAFVWTRLPQGGYPTDLSRIGQGRAAAVLVYDSNFTGGMGVMEIMNGLRGDYARRVDFMVAPLSSADAREFAQRHGANDGVVLLFAVDGRRLDAVDHPRTAAELRQALDRAFGPP